MALYLISGRLIIRLSAQRSGSLQEIPGAGLFLPLWGCAALRLDPSYLEDN